MSESHNLSMANAEHLQRINVTSRASTIQQYGMRSEQSTSRSENMNNLNLAKQVLCANADLLKRKLDKEKDSYLQKKSLLDGYQRELINLQAYNNDIKNLEVDSSIASVSQCS